MSGHPVGEQPQHLGETEEAQSLLDQLLADSRICTRSAEYKVLLDFMGACETARTPTARKLAAVDVADGETTQSSSV